MPELPEVETTRRGVESHVVGRNIAAVRIYDHRLRWPVPRNLDALLRGSRVRALERRSKYLLFRFDHGTLIAHFGMTGSLRVHTKAPERQRHDHLDIELEGGLILRYRDPRRFGAMLWSARTAPVHALLRDLGPEPFDAAFNGLLMWQATRGRKLPIKAALMDNHLVVGVGNIYANESLFRAGIRPGRRASTVSLARMERLASAVREVLEEAIAKGGSTLRDYVDSRGEPGYFQLGYFVYGREGEPCKVCGSRIRSQRIGQRNSFYCPQCQK
jgi:formamidopyrimidine-DNA glycosylase